MNKKDIKDLAKNARPDSSCWASVYAAVIGGQTGWLVTALDDQRRLEGRLSALIAVTDAAVDAAKRAGKIPA